MASDPADQRAQMATDFHAGRRLAGAQDHGHQAALDGWKCKRQKGIVQHGGCCALRYGGRDGLDTQILRRIRDLRYTRQPKSPSPVNKMG